MDKWTYFTDPDVRSWDKETRKRYEIVGSREEALNKGALLADKHRAKEFYIRVSRKEGPPKDSMVIPLN